jgi:pyruvate dehydrogenase E2 component (dihydrolipoamide acetyltransferase)
MSLFEIEGAMSEILMPRLSDSMEEGVILDWLAADGTTVAAGEEIVEIETDKTNVSFEAEESGVLRHQAQAGSVVKVGDPIGFIEQQTKRAPDLATTRIEQSEGEPRVSADGSARQDRRPAQPLPASTSRARATASPTATRLAERLDVRLGDVAGSGPGGRVLRADVIRTFDQSLESREVHSSARTDPDMDASQNPPAPERLKLTRVQHLIADRMADAKNRIPEFWVTSVVDVTALMAVRARLKAAGSDWVPSVNDFVIAAAARALRAQPRMNSRLEDGHIVCQPSINICMAVASEGSLHAPALRNVDTLTLEEISAESARLSTLARETRLALDDLRGGTFTVSNLGMHGARAFNAIIHDNQAAILAVGSAYEAVIVKDGSLRTGWEMHLTLTSDHRHVYGADAAMFLQEIGRHLECPEGLINP